MLKVLFDISKDRENKPNKLIAKRIRREATYAQTK
jgi:hypothetical protein